MAGFLSDEDKDTMIGALDDLWVDLQSTLTVVKEPTITVSSLSGNYIPGWGETSNPNNFTSTPESQDFFFLNINKYPNGEVSVITEKLVPAQDLFIMVQQACRDYILNGRKTLNIVINSKKYNVISEDEAVPFLSKNYYIFKLELVK